MELNSEMECSNAIHLTNLSAIRSLSPVQRTSIDGFFNRKRGRPPKNRFVEVYKSAQPSPQAIFTSFKLEKKDTTSRYTEVAISATVTATSTTKSISSTAVNSRSPNSDGTDPTLFNVNNKPTTKQHQESIFISTKTTSKSQKSNAKRVIIKNTNNKIEGIRMKSSSQSLFQRNTLDKSSSKYIDAITPSHEERVSVVRAAGTFYPQYQSVEIIQSMDSSKKLKWDPYTAIENSVDQPEDLSIKSIKVDPEKPQLRHSTGFGVDVCIDGTEFEERSDTDTETETNFGLLHFQHIFNIYQQQLLFPNYMQRFNIPLQQTEADLPQRDDSSFRSLIANAATQKFLLFNIAAAEAVAVASESTHTNTKSKKPYSGETLSDRDYTTPTGYLKFRFNEDCGFQQCGYRNHQSHFHCNRSDCQYSFCDKTRFVQHTARHERLDTLMGDDFQQFRANTRCSHSFCPYSTSAIKAISFGNADPAAVMVSPLPTKRTSHFHCRKCDYVCADTNKVVAHRRFHSKLEYIRAAGFRKVSINEYCPDVGCPYGLRQTHYHCLTCDCSVLSRAQLSSHKHKAAVTQNPGTDKGT